jgi:hypothetical protein
MSAHGDVERRLADWLAEEAPGRAPGHLREAIDRRLEETPQRGVFPSLRITLPNSRSWILAAVLVTLLVAAVGAGVWVAGSRSVNTAPSPSPVAEPAFTRVAVLSSSGGATFGDVATAGAGLIAVGTIGPNGSQAAAAWTSANGVTWSSVPAVAATGGMLLGRFVAGAAAPVAIGLQCSGAPEPCAFARVTIAGNTAHWEALQWLAGSPTYGVPTTEGSGYGFALRALAADGHTDVMVGWAASRQGPTPIGPAVATSTDGLTWTWRVLAGAQPSGSAMSGVAAGGHGFIAVGTGPTVEPTVWASADGSSWEQVSTATAPTKGELDDLAAGGGVYVAVGRDGTGAAAWVSTDGLTWRQAPSGPSLADGYMTRVTWTGAAFLAVGKTAAEDGAAWVSTDGSSWTRLDTSDIFMGTPIVGGAALGARLILFGQDAAGTVIVAEQGG